MSGSIFFIHKHWTILEKKYLSLTKGLVFCIHTYVCNFTYRFTAYGKQLTGSLAKLPMHKTRNRVEFDIRSWCLKLRDYQTNYFKGVTQFRIENGREQFLSSTTPAGIDEQWDQFKRKILLTGATTVTI